MQYRNILIYLLVLFLPCPFFAQLPKNIDSLKQQTPLLQDSLFIRNLLHIAKYHLMYIEVDSAKKYVQLVHAQENLTDFPRMQAGAMDMMGTLESYVHNYAESLSWLEKAMKAWKAQGDPLGEATSCTNLGRTYAGINAFDKALEMHFRSLEIYKKLNNSRGIFLSLHNISTVFSATEKQEKAIQYKRRALSIPGYTPDTVDQIPVYMGLGADYRELTRYDSAMYFGKIALNLSRKIEHKGFEIRILGSLAHTSNLKEEYFNTLTYLEELYPLLDTTDYNQLGYYHNYLAEAHFGRKEFSEAFRQAHIALNYAKQLQEWVPLNNAYFQLYNFHKKRGPERDALEFYERYLEAQDSIYQQKQLKEIQRLEIVFQTQEKEQEIEELKEASRIQETQLQQNSIKIGLLCLGLLTFLGSGVLVYKNRILQEEVKKSLTEQRLFRAQMNPPFLFSRFGNHSAIYPSRKGLRRVHWVSLQICQTHAQYIRE